MGAKTTCRVCGALLTEPKRPCPRCEEKAQQVWAREYEEIAIDPSKHSDHEVTVAKHVLQQPERYSGKVVAWARARLGGGDPAAPPPPSKKRR